MTYSVREHQTIVSPWQTESQLIGLVRYLDDVWHSRLLFEGTIPADVPRQQPFLTPLYDLKTQRWTLRAGKFAGFIQYEGTTIHILPKLFREEQSGEAFRCLLTWLEYYRRKLPFTDLQTADDPDVAFPEAIIRYFARFTHELIHTQPYHQYEEITDVLPFVRGRLNTSAYAQQCMSRGLFHQLVCDHEPFQFNNRLNQVIKFVARRLSYLCRLPETHRLLEQLLFTLDEVDDRPATTRDCDGIHLPRFYDAYADCLAMCRFFLAETYLNLTEDSQSHFCFLVPMDAVYEDYVAGRLRVELSERFQIETQKQGYLTDEKAFAIFNDIVLTDTQTGKVIVLDTKYKLLKIDEPNAGISQSDLYQMVAYALRRHTRDLILLYPCRYGAQPRPEQSFHVSSHLLPGEPIRIRAIEVDIARPELPSYFSSLLLAP